MSSRKPSHSLFFMLLLLFPFLTVFASPSFHFSNKNGAIQNNLIYQKADSATATIVFETSLQDLHFSGTIKLKNIEYSEERQCYLILVPAKTRQILTVWRKEDPSSRETIPLPSLNARQALVFQISEEKAQINSAKYGQGKISLDTKPSGAYYEFEGLGMSGLTPFQKELAAISFQILVKKDRYKPKSISVKIEKDQTTNHIEELQPDWSDITFKTSTDSSWLELDGILYRFPINSNLISFQGEKHGLSNGWHYYKFATPCSDTLIDSIFATGESRTIQLDRKISRSFISINTIPGFAEVFWDGKFRGNTPVQFKSTIGKHSLRIFKEKHMPFDTILNVSTCHTEQTTNLERIIFLTTLKCVQGSSFYLDNQILGSCPSAFLLPKGQSLIQTSHPDYEQFVDTIHEPVPKLVET